MSTKNNPSFPTGYTEHQGLTKEEYFTAAALQGLLSNPNVTINLHSILSKDIEAYALTIARKTIAELDK